MKTKIIYILMVLLMTNLMNAQQSFRFVYEYSYAPDSANVEKKITETYYLDITDDQTLFYNVKHKSHDTLYINDDFLYSDFDYRIAQHKADPTLTEYFNISDFAYAVKDKVEFKWTVNKASDKILGYDVQEAACTFRGRKWKARFAKELPFQNGPYKFSGLPGLIVKISDDKNTHTFALTAIESLKEKLIIVPEKMIDISKVKFKKVLDGFRKNSQKELMNIEVTSTEDGLTNEEFKNKMREYYKRKHKGNNNFIELQ